MAYLHAVSRLWHAYAMHLLIDTKFEMPVLLPSLVARGALLDQLDRVMDRRLAVVSAPAGFGKTTLISQWCQRAHARGIDIAWLSLGERENETGRLIDYIVGALARVSDKIVATLPAIVAASPSLPMDVIVTRLVNGIGAWRRDLVLVIDDVHFLADPEIGSVLDALLTYAPANFRMLLATRGSVPVKVATLRMRDLVVRLDEASLRFSLDEAVSFLNGCRSLGLNEPDILTLQNRTEGWIAGLQLASLALSDTDDRSRFLQRFSGATGDIAAFLLQDVLGQLGVGLQMRPARLLRDPEDVLGQVGVRVFGILRIVGQQRLALELKPVRDVLEEDQAQSNVLVVRRLHIAA
jgi:LuxR family maltose regulon positive regulatory protein